MAKIKKLRKILKTARQTRYIKYFGLTIQMMTNFLSTPMKWGQQWNTI